MMEFQETVHFIKRKFLPTEALMVIWDCDESETEDYDADDEVADVEVEVEYNPGYHQAGNRSGHPDSWTPDEGEACEILAVRVTGTSHDVLDDLTRSEVEQFEAMAWDDMEAQAEDAGEAAAEARYEDDGGLIRHLMS